MKKFEIKTRMTRQSNDALKVRVTVKNGWKFWNDFYLKNDGKGYGYVKSDEFKEFLNSIFSKYEGLTYDEMLPIWKTDNKGDEKMIGEKLDKYAYYNNNEEPFKILVDTKLVKRYSNGFEYKVIFSNNKGTGTLYYNKFQKEPCYLEINYANEELWFIGNKLCKSKELSDKLATYTNWEQFNNDVLKKGNADFNALVHQICAA